MVTQWIPNPLLSVRFGYAPLNKDPASAGPRRGPWGLSVHVGVLERESWVERPVVTNALKPR